MFRDRTNLYISYRRTFPHRGQLKRTTNELGTPLLQSDIFSDEYDMEMGEFNNSDDDLNQFKSGKLLPPLFIDIARDIDGFMTEIDNQMEQLMKLYRKNALPGFDDKTHDTQLIEDISLKILQYFQKSYNIVKKLEVIYNEQFLEGKQLNKSELLILNSLTKNYAQKIQYESNKFRMLQNKYLKFLNKDDLKPILPKNNYETSQLLLQEEEEMGGKDFMEQDIEEYNNKTLQKQISRTKDGNQAFLESRDEEITQLARGVYEVSTIFREMQSLIINQGTIVDRIDYNLENTVVQLREANKELKGAERIQKKTQKCKIILLLTLCVIALFFFVMLKPHSKTVTKYETVEVSGPAKEQNTISAVSNEGGADKKIEIVNNDKDLGLKQTDNAEIDFIGVDEVTVKNFEN